MGRLPIDNSSNDKIRINQDSVRTKVIAIEPERTVAVLFRYLP